MSLFDDQAVRTTGPPNSESVTTSHSSTASLENVTDLDPTSARGFNGVDPHQEARTIVRLIQCAQCSLPLRNPLTLPCGNSLCRKCVPELHTRTNISYPRTEGRQEAFFCPFEDCRQDHPLGDCSQDVTLAKVVDRVSIEVARCRPLMADTPTLLDERPRWKNIVDSSKETRVPSSQILNGGRLLATYTLAEIGKLRYDSEVSYQTMSPTGDTYENLDTAMLSHFKEATKSEVDCLVCYGLILDPLTTTCGHTFCRKCVARVLDHSTLCPVCRRELSMPPGVQRVPGNRRLSKLLDGLCPDLVAARAAAAALEEGAMIGEKNVPLFICTLAYPSMPTFLHIFEPRYRLMIRRAVESGDRKFGMLMYNRRREPQGTLGYTDFMLYGTLLHINSVQMLPDGRSLLETVGVSRFAVKDWSRLDGYIVGNVERIDDMSITEEEQAEASETTQVATGEDRSTSEIDRMSTQDLLQIGTNFITRMRAVSAPWLHESVLASYGSPPDDPALFPYWFASVLPISDDEKYQLLPTLSVRQRLKITAGWVKRIEAARWAPAPRETSTDMTEEHDDDHEDIEVEFEEEIEGMDTDPEIYLQEISSDEDEDGNDDHEERLEEDTTMTDTDNNNNNTGAESGPN